MTHTTKPGFAGGRWIGCLLLLWLFAAAFPDSEALAHPEGFSGLHVSVMPERILVAITLHTRDLGAWFPPGKYPDYVNDVCREMEKTIGEIVEIQIDGESQPVTKAKAFLLEVGLIEVDVEYESPASPEPVELLVWSKHLILMPRDHRQLLFVEDRRDLPPGEEVGPLLFEDVLTTERDAGAVVLSPAKTNSRPSANGPMDSQSEPTPTPESPSLSDPEKEPEARKPKRRMGSEDSPQPISFFRFGIEHIITGYDHLLFLAALLLTCTRFKEAAVIITCFTIAHSVTLALAALDVVRLPGEIVEPVIALSIVCVAVENLFGTPPLWRRAAITGLFGLVHGLGFASALRDIGLGTIPGGVLWPLLKFNLGVEAGQLAIAAVFLPVVFLVRKDEVLSQWFVKLGSLAVALLGGYWFVTRVMSHFSGG